MPQPTLETQLLWACNKYEELVNKVAAAHEQMVVALDELTTHYADVRSVIAQAEHKQREAEALAGKQKEGAPSQGGSPDAPSSG